MGSILAAAGYWKLPHRDCEGSYCRATRLLAQTARIQVTSPQYLGLYLKRGLYHDFWLYVRTMMVSAVCCI